MPLLEEQGLIFSGKDDSQQRMEIVELPLPFSQPRATAAIAAAEGANSDSNHMDTETQQHPFFVGVQFHPEFQSRWGCMRASVRVCVGCSSNSIAACLCADRLLLRLYDEMLAMIINCYLLVLYRYMMAVVFVCYLLVFRPLRPAPVFKGLLEAVKARREGSVVG